MTTRKLIHGEVVVGRPVGQDSVHVYKLRSWENEDRTLTQEYGGFDEWTEYSGYQALDLTKGCITLSGHDLRQLQDATKRLTDHDEYLLSQLYRQLKAIYLERGAA